MGLQMLSPTSPNTDVLAATEMLSPRTPPRSPKFSPDTIFTKDNVLASSNARDEHGSERVGPMLKTEQSKSLELNQIDRLERVTHMYRDGDERSEHDHPHVEIAKSIISAFVSAVINFLLMFGLCCAYGLIMFEHAWHSQHRGLAVKMNLASSFLVGLVLALASKIPVAIGGPDLNPVVFLGIFTTTIAEDLAKQKALVYPDTGTRRLLEECSILEVGDLIRRLGSSSGSSVEFCNGDHYMSNVEACTSYHAELVATTIFTVAASSAIMAFVYFSLGSCKLTNLVTYVPTNIMEAFLSCVGYKVFKYALIFCDYEPKQFIPAACVGVPLYFLKTLHIGNPALVIPLMLLIPLAVFYGALYASGGDISTARKDGLMFDKLENADFWSVWRDGLGIGVSGSSFGGNINFSAWAKTLPDLPIMVVVCFLDCLLKLHSTESKLPVNVDKDYEMQLYGFANVLTTLSGSSVGYMQLKFNVINYGILRNIVDRRGGILYALLSGISFFWTTDLFNYLPRFFLSTLLFFAGAGFVAENLWGSRNYLSTAEWLQIFGILAVFIFTGSLFYAVIVGGLSAGGLFIVRYARFPCIQGHPLKGGELSCCVRNSFLMDCSIRHIANHRALIIHLKGYIFFASGEKMTSWVLKRLQNERNTVPEYKRLHWIVFDCAMLDGLDSSASRCIGKLVKAATAWDVRIIWTGMSSEFRKMLEACSTIQNEQDWFDHVDTAIQHVHQSISADLLRTQQSLIELHSFYELAHRQAFDRYDFDPFARILSRDAEYFGCPWSYCTVNRIKAYETVLWRPGESPTYLYLIYSGQVGLFNTLPMDDSERIAWENPFAVYTRGWFLNRSAIFSLATQANAVALQDGEVLSWSELQWERMARERPNMAKAILTAVFEQEAQDARSIEEIGHSISGEMFNFDDDDVMMVVHNEEVLHKERMNTAHHVRHDFNGMSVAQELDRIGLFAPVKESEEFAISLLPLQIIQDIESAFHACAEVGLTAITHQAVIRKQSIIDAMRYAGVYYVSVLDPGIDLLTKTEFFSICRRALLPPLSTSIAKDIQNLFESALETGATTMSQEEFYIFFKSFLQCDIPEIDVFGLSNVWTLRSDDRVEVYTFLAVMCRLVARHTQEWLVLKGSSELLGEAAISRGEEITADTLVSAHPELSRKDAEEVIWMNSFCDSAGSCCSLSIKSLAVALRMAPASTGFLPANRARAEEAQVMQESSSASLRSSDSKDAEVMQERRELSLRNSALTDANAYDTSFKVRNLVVDVRNEIPRLYALDWSLTACIEGTFSANWDENRKFSEATKDVVLIPDTLAAKLWLLLDDPNSSAAANMLSMASYVLILASVLTLVAEPLISPKNEAVSSLEKAIWFSLEAFFTIVFTLEYLLGLLVCTSLGTQTRLDWLRHPMNICDLVAVLPFYVEQIIDIEQEEFRLLRAVRLTRLARVIRIGRLAKMNKQFAPIAMILVVIWGIYMKNGLGD